MPNGDGHTTATAGQRFPPDQVDALRTLTGSTAAAQLFAQARAGGDDSLAALGAYQPPLLVATQVAGPGQASFRVGHDGKVVFDAQALLAAMPAPMLALFGSEVSNERPLPTGEFFGGPRWSLAEHVAQLSAEFARDPYLVIKNDRVAVADSKWKMERVDKLASLGSEEIRRALTDAALALSQLSAGPAVYPRSHDLADLLRFNQRWWDDVYLVYPAKSALLFLESIRFFQQALGLRWVEMYQQTQPRGELRSIWDRVMEHAEPLFKASLRRQPCRAYNATHGCSTSMCRYAHECLLCGHGGHMAAKCQGLSSFLRGVGAEMKGRGGGAAREGADGVGAPAGAAPAAPFRR